MASRDCTRREALMRAAALAVAGLLCACQGDGEGTTLPLDSIVRDGRTLTIRLDRVAALALPRSGAVFAAQQLIVVRMDRDEFRAFSNVCTHAGCGIQAFRSERMVCQCHGSEFDLDGRNVAGPAPAPLEAYAVAYDAAARQLRITLPG